MSLKDQLIKLGNQQPDLRKHLRPILDALYQKNALRKDDPETKRGLVEKNLKSLGISKGDVARLEVFGYDDEFRAELALKPTMKNVSEIIHMAPRQAQWDSEALKEDLQRDLSKGYPKSKDEMELYPDLFDRKGPVKADLRRTDDQLVIVGKVDV